TPEPGQLVAPPRPELTVVPDPAQDAVAPAANGPVFTAEHLEVITQDGAHLLNDISLTVPAGTLVGLLGPSGAGKSTLLDALTGLRPATSGKISWNGQDLYGEDDQLRNLIGLVPQEDVLHRNL